MPPALLIMETVCRISDSGKPRLVEILIPWIRRGKKGNLAAWTLK